MLKLCPLFLEGANLYIQIIALLCCVQHHNFITNLKCLLMEKRTTEQTSHSVQLVLTEEAVVGAI